VIYNALLFLVFLAMMIVFAWNVFGALSRGSVGARNAVIQWSEHPFAFAVATGASILLGLACLAMVLVIGSHLIGIEI
jgi:hypothetical protein